ncbi:MAG: ABC transporter permease [Candidatus Hodarchaeales archaeon]|jgi:ABC-type sugar transport system permease subunit
MTDKSIEIKTPVKEIKPPSDKKFVISMLSPSFLLFIIGIAVPLFLAFYISMINSTGLQLFGKYRGFDNFKEFLLPKHRFTRTFYQYTYQTIFFVVISVTLEFFLGLGFALLLNKEFRGRSLARAALLVPWALPTVVSATIFLEVFAPINNYGVINNIMDTFGMATVSFYGDSLENIGSHSVPLLSDSSPYYEMSDTIEMRYEMVMLTVIMVEVWKTTPFLALLLLAALQLVPEDLYKAADIEGANAWQKFRYITWPTIRGPALIAVLFRTIDAIRVYDAVVVFGDGGVQSITVVAVNAWNQNQFGVASAIAIFELLLILIFALIIFKGNKYSNLGVLTVFLLLFNRFLEIGVIVFLLILAYIYFMKFIERDGLKKVKETVGLSNFNLDLKFFTRKEKTREKPTFRLQNKQVIRLKRYTNRFLFIVGIFSIVSFCLAPFIWVFIRSFRDPCQRVNADQGCTSSTPPQNDFEFLPKHPSIQSYKIIFTSSNADIDRALLNGFILAGTTALLVVILGSLVAAILAKYQFRFQTLFILMIFAMSSLPPIIIIIPYILQINWLADHNINIREMNWIKIGGSHYPGPLFPLILPYVAFNLPLGVFLLRSFFAEIPDELILAAKVDGATNFQIFRKILLPLTRPGIFTTAMMVFIFAWNELLFARMFLIQSDQFYTVPLSILQFQKSSSELTGIPWVPELVLNAASIIATLPLIIMVLILQKNIIKGITAGAVKG